MLEIEEIIGCFDIDNEKCVHQNVLIARLQNKGFGEIEINEAVNKALALGMLKHNSLDQICVNCE